MDDATIKQLVEDAAKQAAVAAVHETLKTLGIDASHPFEVQKDMQHLRDWRIAVGTVKRQGLLTATGIVVAGVIGVIWLAIKGVPG